MCGIVGIISKDNNSNLQNSIMNMMDALKHRGPDSSNFFINKHQGIVLGHQRLAVQDLSIHGSQPMSSNDNKWTLVFNGEIYNHLDLRESVKELKTYKWRGTSDTETILALVSTLGIKQSLNLMVGMFALAIYDNTNNTLYLARDRFGEKPLYYGVPRGRDGKAFFVFASELKAIVKYNNFRKEINPIAAQEYFSNLCISQKNSIFKDINKVEPGFFLEISCTSFSIINHNYWELDNSISKNANSSLKRSFSDINEEFKKLLVESVKGQMLSDVPLGAFLSGGIDSSLIVSIMQSLSNSKIKTFSVRFDEEKYNEADHAKCIADYLQTDHTDVALESDKIFNLIEKVIEVYDEPFADSSAIPTLLVSQIARESVTVALSGDAGDEVFGGYNRHAFIRSYWQLLARISGDNKEKIASLIKRNQNFINRFSNTDLASSKWQFLDKLLIKASRSLDQNNIKDFYSSIVNVGWREDSPLKNEINASYSPKEGKFYNSYLDEIMQLDLLNYLPDDILTKVDRAAMSVSLETRIPFLDHRLVEFMFSMDDDIKIKKSFVPFTHTTKFLLREFLSEFMPKKLFTRPKVGFGVPLASWLRGPLNEWCLDTLASSNLNDIDILDSRKINIILEEHMNATADHHEKLWTTLMFVEWYKRYQAIK